MFNTMPDKEVNIKLKTVLNKLLEPNYIINDDMYLEKLFNFCKENKQSELQLCSEWMTVASMKWEEVPRHSSLTSFGLRILGLIVAEKKGFKLFRKDGLSHIISVMNIHCASVPSVKLAFVTMLSALVKHDDGCEYISDSGIWKDVVKYCYEDKSIYVNRESQKFVSEFLKAFINENPSVCEEVIHHSFRPLLTLNIKSDSSVVSPVIIHKYIFELSPVIEMACHLYESMLSDTQLCCLLSQFDVETVSWNLITLTEDISFISKLSRLLTLAYFASLQCKTKTNEIAFSDFKQFEAKLYKLIGFLIPKGVKCCTTTLVQCQIYWHKLSPTILDESGKDSKKFIFQNQLITLQLIPIFTSIVTTKISENEYLDVYCNKVYALTYESTQRLCYSFRDSVFALDNRHESLHTAVLSLLQVKDILDRDQAIIVFQALMYILKDFVPELDPRPRAPHSGLSSDEILVLYPEVLSTILETLTCLINCFHITWRESLESICLYTFMNQLLKNPNLSGKLAVKTLKLMQEVIMNFMPPNLALLVNTLEGSTISQLGPMLFKRMHDVSWEVRDSALEVLHSVTCIAEIKFTAFQEHILENELCMLCVSMAVDDIESYVRASAIKCLCAMVRVEKFWAQSLSALNLPAKMVKILKYESEGLVRKEAAALMKELFEHQKIPRTLLEDVFETMVIGAIKDLHWEVQVNSLDFWHKVIEQQMSYQGMIDGVFPSVTFSKENRKIVNLTEKEIKIRLGKVLEELSRLGCLEVLLTSLDDCNHQVVSKAVSIVSYMSQILSQHGVLPVEVLEKETKGLPDLVSSSCIKKDMSELCTVPVLDTSAADYYVSKETYRPAVKVPRLVQNGENEPSRVVPPNCGNASEPEKNSDQVIEAIVKESDMSLLQKVYHDQMKISVSEESKVKTVGISAEEFLVKISEINLTKHMAMKTDWLNYCCDDLGSLLDDILASSLGQESNAIDCY